MNILSGKKRADIITGKIAEFERNIAECQKIAEEFSTAEKLMTEWQMKYDETERISNDYKAVIAIHNEIDLQKKKIEKYREEYISAREKLRDGQPCPVCGSLDHPKPCVIPDIYSGLTREVIDRLTAEVSELDNIQNKKSAQVRSANDTLREREESFDIAMKNLYERMAKIIPDVSENPDIKQVGEILSDWKSYITAEGKILSYNVRKYQKAVGMIEKYSVEKNSLIPEFEKINSSLSELQSDIIGSMRIKEEMTKSLYYTDKISAEKALSVSENLKNEKTAVHNNISSRLDSAGKNLEQARTLAKKYNEEIPELKKTFLLRKSEYKDIVEKYALREWHDVTEKFTKDYTDILQSEIESHNKRKLLAQTTYSIAEKSVKNSVRPDIELLEKSCISATAVLEKAQKNFDVCRDICKADSDVYKFLLSQAKDYDDISEHYANLKHLCDRLSGTASGEHIGIETFVQRYYLQKILDGANVHFQRMSGGQFELRLMDEKQASSSGRTENGLELTVYSTVNESERKVNTLSGGETFMAALSLALGMSEQIQENAVSVTPDIMFIDEGFGSLDDHSRNQSIKVLKEMSVENRFICIISHVTEMKQEIDNQFVITKDKKGSHAHWIIN